MVFCSKCGKQSIDGSVFCFSCGTGLPFPSLVHDLTLKRPADIQVLNEQPKKRAPQRCTKCHLPFKGHKECKGKCTIDNCDHLEHKNTRKAPPSNESSLSLIPSPLDSASSVPIPSAISIQEKVAEHSIKLQNERDKVMESTRKILLILEEFDPYYKTEDGQIKAMTLASRFWGMAGALLGKSGCRKGNMEDVDSLISNGFGYLPLLTRHKSHTEDPLLKHIAGALVDRLIASPTPIYQHNQTLTSEPLLQIKADPKSSENNSDEIVIGPKITHSD